MNFANVAKNEANFTRTENDAIALRTTESPLVDLFATVGALRLKSEDEVQGMFRLALAENKLLAVKTMFYARNVRGGLGERETFRKMLAGLAKTNPEIVLKNMHLIPVFGRYDDLYTLVGTSVENEMWDFIKKTIVEDAKNFKENKPISLCAKWLKSINTSSPKSIKLGKLTAQHLGLTEKNYRKMLADLRKYIKVIETSMSAKNWKAIEYSNVPSHAMKNYRNAFKKHDEVRFDQFMTKVEKGEETIKASTLYPYDILMAAELHYSWASNRNQRFTIKTDRVLEEQWKALPNFVEGENNVLVMADTSGSMEGLPMATSIGLAIYFAERNKGAYKDLFMTFSEHPEFVHLRGDTLKSKIECVESIVANTDLEAAFNLILKVAKENDVPQEEMPKALVIISDMQFDGGQVRCGRSETFFKSMQRKFAEAGYEMPVTIYWNVEERTKGTFQAKRNENGVVLVSGHSTSTFKAVISNIGKTPWDFMVETLSNPMYDCVTV